MTESVRNSYAKIGRKEAIEGIRREEIQQDYLLMELALVEVRKIETIILIDNLERLVEYGERQQSFRSR